MKNSARFMLSIEISGSRCVLFERPTTLASTAARGFRRASSAENVATRIWFHAAGYVAFQVVGLPHGDSR